MAGETHPMAPHALPHFITPPGETDGLMVVLAAGLALGVLGLGVLYLTLHALPERLAHRRGKGQVELVAVLALIALFTHQNIFWIAALLVAIIEPPDLVTPIGRIASALERMAGRRAVDGDAGKDAGSDEGAATRRESAP